MTIERAVLTGQILNQVVTKNMFTAEVTEVGGDTSPLLWDVYINQFAVQWQELAAELVAITSYEIQRRVGSQWETTGFFDVTFASGNTGDQIVNAVASVLVGKALGVRRMGRKFMSGLAGAVVEGNALSTGAMAEAVLLLALYVSPVIGIGGGTLQPGILDKNGTFHPFVGGFVSTFLGSMRRRKPGVGI